jgi:hypothetical protein
VAGGGDGQELGDSLNGAQQDDGNPIRHAGDEPDLGGIQQAQSRFGAIEWILPNGRDPIPRQVFLQVFGSRADK